MGGGVMSSALVARSEMFELVASNAQSIPTLVGFRTHLLEMARKGVAADTLAFIDRPTPTSGSLSRSAVLGISTEHCELFFAHRSRYERSLGKMLKAMASGVPIVDTDIYSANERERIDIYNEVLRPQGTTCVLAAVLGGRGRAAGFIVLGRQGPGARFSSADTLELAKILPALWLADAGFQYSLRAEQVLGVEEHRESLSHREVQVAQLVTKGMQNDEIAVLLGTTVSTVKKQVRRVLDKAGVSNRTELAGLLGSWNPD
jgi:DNA-binding CsgD family transcriptional regulator